MKRKFKITAVGYGGEYAICTKDVGFVDDWSEMIENGDSSEHDLVQEVKDTFYDEADIEHGYGMYSDGLFTLCEIKDGEEEEIRDDLSISTFMSREAYITDSGNGSVPVLLFHGSEKGIFASWEVETDGEDLDLQKLVISEVETDVGGFVQDLYYDGQLLEIDSDCVDTREKSFTAKVGWINPEWHENKETFNEESAKECWSYYKEEL